MTIAELIKLLTKIAAQTGANVPVIVSSVPEGNSYMSLGGGTTRLTNASMI